MREAAMAGKLTFGYLYDFRNPPGWPRPLDQLYAETLDVMVETEKLGFGGAWLPEHHLAADDYLPSPMIVLAALAARTSTMKIGTGIVLAPLYDPVRFAEDCAVLDILSRGRLEMGLAIGYRKKEYDAFGLDFTKRGARFDEFLQIVRALWAGETVNFEGEHYTVRNARITPLSPRGQIHLNIGGFVEKAIERVAKYGDGYFGISEMADTYVRKWQEQGKKPEDAAMQIPGLYTFVARDPDSAMEELAPHYHYMLQAYDVFAQEDKALGMDSADPSGMDLDAFKASGTLQIWKPDEAIEKFRSMRQKMPLTHYCFSMPPGLPPERFLAYAREFAEDVIPAFA
jgi:alkanesulfonate monooxygenase SsuD/methylene tetrahydromethanopterin reductase-like flavin-dependent oxidoreductase (luciferase family)